MTAHAHDALFKAMFGTPETAEGLLRAVLPPEVVATIDWSSLTVESTTFIDPNLAEYRSDLVCRARFVDGGDAVLYVLVEHQSSVDPDMPLRVLGYELRIWEQFRAEVRRGPRPAIIPIVIAHVPGGWTEPTAFGALYPPAVRRAALGHLLPQFEVCLVDLAHTTDDDIRAWTLDVFQQIALVLLRDARDRLRLDTTLDAWSAELALAYGSAMRAPTGMRAFAQLVRYMFLVTKDLGAARFRGKLLKHLPAAKETVMTIAEELREEGREKGREQGRAEATAESLRVVLAHKFGPLDTAIDARLATATLDELKAYLNRALTANSLAAVFGDA